MGVWCGVRRCATDVISSVFQAAATDNAYQRVGSAKFSGASLFTQTRTVTKPLECYLAKMVKVCRQLFRRTRRNSAGYKSWCQRPFGSFRNPYAIVYRSSFGGYSTARKFFVANCLNLFQCNLHRLFFAEASIIHVELVREGILSESRWLVARRSFVICHRILLLQFCHRATLLLSSVENWRIAIEAILIASPMSPAKKAVMRLRCACEQRRYKNLGFAFFVHEVGDRDSVQRGGSVWGGESVRTVVREALPATCLEICRNAA